MLPQLVNLPSLELRRIASEGGTWMPSLHAFTSPLDDDDPVEAGQPYAGWPVRSGAGLTDLEKAWVTIVAEHRDNVAASAVHALGRAGRDAGLQGANVVTDDARVAGWLDAQGVRYAWVRYDARFFNENIKIKTEPEIDLMRAAALRNERAMLAATDALADGAIWHQIETSYMTEMARQGARDVYCICGVGGLPAGRVRRGEPVLFDRVAIETGRGSGFPEFRYVTPHGLGLEHTDDPKPLGVQLGTKPDQALEAGMVINVDMPYTEIGWGSLHIEDTALVTDDGHELLTTADLKLCCVPG